jgi:hypothetical protein
MMRQARLAVLEYADRDAHDRAYSKADRSTPTLVLQTHQSAHTSGREFVPELEDDLGHGHPTLRVPRHCPPILINDESTLGGQA